MFSQTTGISSYFKQCPECLCVYQYQEYSQGVHNFDNFWFLSLGVCDYLRQQLKVKMITCYHYYLSYYQHSVE